MSNCKISMLIKKMLISLIVLPLTHVCAFKAFLSEKHNLVQSDMWGGSAYRNKAEYTIFIR